MQDDIDRRHGSWAPDTAPCEMEHSRADTNIGPAIKTGPNLTERELVVSGCIPASVQSGSQFANREQPCKSDSARRNIPLEVSDCDLKVSQFGKGEHKDAGKPRLDLLDPYAIEQMGHVLAFGAVKYGDPFNYTRGIAYLRLTGSALRHIFAFIRGEDTDPESGHPHLAHGMCCLMMLLSMTQRHPELDDRCKTEAA